MSPDVAEVVQRFTVMDQRMLTVRRIHRVLVRMRIPIVGLGAVAVRLIWLADGWFSKTVWATIGCVSVYVLCWAGEQLCSIAMQLLELNLEECKAIGSKEGE